MIREYLSPRRKLITSLQSAIGKTAVILPSAFMVETGLGMANLGLIFYIRDVYGLSPSLVGWFGATWLGCYVAGCLLLQPLIVRMRARYSMIISSSGLALCIAGILILDSVVSTYLLYGLFGLSLSLFWPPLMGWLSVGNEGGELSKSMGRLTLAGSSGIIISPYLAGLLSDIDPIYPVYGALLMFTLTTFLVIGASFFLPKIRKDKMTDLTRRAESPQTDKSTLFRFPAWIGLFGSCVVLGVIMNIFPVYARADLAMGKSTIGMVLLVRALSQLGAYIVLGRTKFWHFRPLLMIIGVTIDLLCILLLPWARPIGLLILLMIVLGPMHSIAFSYSFFHGVSGSQERARRMAIHEAFLAGGIITGSIVGGVLYQHYSIRAVSFFCVVLTACVIACQIVLSLYTLRKEKTVL